ncbi:hypothetical protein C2S51_010562 [Perilla frutescens var. frutescens]|nr:hypothetical protein C2S51_010562 [Perilla frutescens var. frutescens]
MGDDKNGEVAVVVVPFPAQGHLNPLLHLSRRISGHNIPVYFVGTATHVRQVTGRVQGCDPSTICNLHFHSFPTPPFENPTPDHSAPTSKFPTHMHPMIMATTSHFQQPLHELLSELSSRNHGRIAVIFDVLMSTVVKAVYQTLPNLECYCFQVTPASFIYSLFVEAAGKGVLPSDSAGIMNDVREMEGCFSHDFKQLLDLQRKARDFHVGNIYHTSRIIEAEYIDLLAKTRILGHDNHWALGPFIPVAEHEKHESKSSRSQCLIWLDNQPPNSVIFVSFGTTCSLSDEQIGELALGLERSEQRFLWSLRDADRGDVFDGGVRRAELPEGFEERVRERGFVVREWAPQLEILEHSATGGFLSHCGWNSCLESISKGVPVAAWPMNSDQPRNAVLLVKALKIGVEVRDWARRDQVVGATTVEEGVRRLMASAEGEEMRRRAAELADSLKQSFMEGGVGRREMDSFVAHITR